MEQFHVPTRCLDKSSAAKYPTSPMQCNGPSYTRPGNGPNTVRSAGRDQLSTRVNSCVIYRRKTSIRRHPISTGNSTVREIAALTLLVLERQSVFLFFLFSPLSRTKERSPVSSGCNDQRPIMTG